VSDGRIFPVSSTPKPGATFGQLDFMGLWYPIQVKQKDKAGRPDIDSFEAAMIREDRQKGFFVAFDFSSDALTKIDSEIDSFFRKQREVIIPRAIVKCRGWRLMVKRRFSLHL
jgi:hypothetical protein